MALCIFGDSVAKGVIYDEVKKKYTYLKDCFVSNFSEGTKIPVKNYARFGCTTDKGAELLSLHQQELGKYRYTILEFGGNDCDYNWEQVSASPEAAHQPHVPLNRFESNLRNMIAQVRANDSTPVVLSLPPIDAQRFFHWVSRGLNKENILKFLGDINFIYRWHEAYNLCLFDIAQSLSVPFVDIRKDFLAIRDYQKYLCSDGMHPNKAGHCLITSAILRQYPS